jgi:hypothetical protein
MYGAIMLKDSFEWKLAGKDLGNEAQYPEMHFHNDKSAANDHGSAERTFKRFRYEPEARDGMTFLSLKDGSRKRALFDNPLKVDIFIRLDRLRTSCIAKPDSNWWPAIDPYEIDRDGARICERERLGKGTGGSCVRTWRINEYARNICEVS